ncbi:hypothetical protein MTR67_044485 [Solanum verrucosum]|uniref:Uncharacterized protein n=1 Tax=Solanum verrucosum TaxID=315347 RepID=A0AAF0UQY0_SOLVR|nr:hypothetical protein MTR67_044485 [Solanum verrucosum]
MEFELAMSARIRVCLGTSNRSRVSATSRL